jgi:hypothetical protein
MPDLSFTVEAAEATPFAATPLLTFKLRVQNACAEESIHAALLRCQVRIEPARRHYQPHEQEGLRDLFGEPARWGQTLRAMLWTHVSVTLPPFAGSVVADLPIPCTFDFNVAATRYFHALEGGEVPLVFLFSGTVFHEGEDGALRVAQVPWEKETTFRLPVRTWREMLDHYYPNTAWLCLRRDLFDRVHRHKTKRGLPTWEQALEDLLRRAEGPDHEPH